MRKRHPILFIFVLSALFTSGQQRILDSNFHDLRIGKEAEWAGFSSDPSTQLKIEFTIDKIQDYTLSLVAEDIKQEWELWLNETKLGVLGTDELPTLTYWTISTNALKQGKNILLIKQVDSATDDIRIGRIVLHEVPLSKLLNESQVRILVRDEMQHPIPARLTIISKRKELQPASVQSNDTLAVRAGCIYTSTGNASFGLPVGDYTIYASRGFEYSVDSFSISIKKNGWTDRNMIIKKEVPTDGWISCDTHIHTFSFSKHGDATLSERAITIAGEGIEMPVMTDHNVYVDIDSTARVMNVRSYYTPVTGNEYTTRVGHFNVFPVDKASKVPAPNAENWNAVKNKLKNSDKNSAIILNHARDIHSQFRPFGPDHHVAVAGFSPAEHVFPAKAMEVMNSGSQQNDIMQLYHDWFGMLNGGMLITPVGSSDSHDVMRFLVGQGRTYIKYNEENVSNINVQDATESFLEGRVMVSFGLLAELTINKMYGPGELASTSDSYTASVRVLGPSWLKAERISLYANGERIFAEKIIDEKKGGVKWSGSWTIPVSNQDLFLVAIAEGPGEANPFWAIPKPYQPKSIEWNPRIIGSSGAVWIDVDRNGKKTSANDYARQLLSEAKSDYEKLFAGLARYDRAVTIQTACMLQRQGISASDERIKILISKAPAQVQSGFELFSKAWEGLIDNGQ